MKRKFPRFIAAFIILAGGGASAFYIMSLINTPAEGVIKPIKSVSPELAKEKEKALESYEGKYVNFSFPSNYRKLPTPKNTYIETVNLLGNDVGSDEISVNVSQETLAENSAVRIRRLQTQIYTEQPLELPNLSGFVFTKQLPEFEKTAIVEHNNMVASIAVSSKVGRDLNKDFNTVIQSFTWKQ